MDSYTGEAAGCDLGQVPAVHTEQHHHVRRHTAQLPDEPAGGAEDPSISQCSPEPGARPRAAAVGWLPQGHRLPGRLGAAQPQALGALRLVAQVQEAALQGRPCPVS